MITITPITKTRGTTVPSSPAAFCNAVAATVVAPSGVQFGTTRVWDDVRLDGHAAMGLTAWSPPT